MDFLIENNAESTLAAGIAAGDLSLSVQAADAARFPSPGVGQSFYLTLERVNTGAKEIVRCTARAGVVLTIVRAQEGTAALSFVAGDIVSLRITKGTLQDNTFREVGDPGEPGFQNGWVNFGGGFHNVGFRKTIEGEVVLRGLAKLGAPINSTVFTLPVGYRPTAQCVFAIASNGAFGYMTVAATGDVQVAGGSNVWVSLHGIRFRAEQ